MTKARRVLARIGEIPTPALPTTALIIGAAAGVLEDLAEAERLVGALASRLAVIRLAVNDGGVVYRGPIDHWCTLHAEELPDRMIAREAAGGPSGFLTWDYDGGAEFSVPAGHRIYGCSSAMVAATVARHLGSRRIILCGVPLDRRGYAMRHRHHGTDVWEFAERNQARLQIQAAKRTWLTTDVRSMSGWTREFFGAPTPTWLLNGVHSQHHAGAPQNVGTDL